MFSRLVARWSLVPFFLCLGLVPSLAAEQEGITPSRITFKGDGVLLSEVLAVVGKQSGVRVEDRTGEPGTKVSVALKQARFWEALDQIAEAAKARVYLYPRDGRIALLKRDAGYQSPPVSYDGVFRTTVKRIAATRDLETTTPAYTATLEVAWEPRLQPLFLETRPQGLIVKDDKSKALPASTEGSAPAPVDGRLSLVFDVPLPVIPRPVGKIGLLEGKLSVIAPSKMLDFFFDPLDQLAKAPAAGEERRKMQDGVVCQISKVTLAQDRWTVQVTLEYPPGDVKFDSYQSWVVNNEMVLEAKDGSKRLASSGYVIESSSERKAVLSYHFTDKDKQVRGRPRDWKLFYRTPASIVRVPLTFSFKDVELP